METDYIYLTVNEVKNVLTLEIKYEYNGCWFYKNLYNFQDQDIHVKLQQLAFLEYAENHFFNFVN